MHDTDRYTVRELVAATVREVATGPTSGHAWAIGSGAAGGLLPALGPQSVVIYAGALAVPGAWVVAGAGTPLDELRTQATGKRSNARSFRCW